ncbi:MAG: glycosyl hydrolase family 28-related protein [Bacteroidota bacterium]
MNKIFFRVVGCMFFLQLINYDIVTAQGLRNMEEFNGPYDSWANAKTRFGAKGNGKDDDTKAIQKAIDQLGENSATGGPAFSVLFLPAGTYCISATLVLRGKIGVTITGENPANTTIKWIGGDGGTMFWANGSAYYKISRFTWDANKRKGIEAIGIHWRNRWKDEKSQSYASLNIEISDNIFIGKCKYGISGGTNPEDGTNSNDSEIAIKRCVFQDCTEAGIFTTGYNALDYWIWDCKFYNCNIGINNKYGNFHAYRSYFKNSLQADVTNTNGYYKSVRNCFSEDSKGFAVDSGASTNPFKRIYQGNTVLRQRGIPIQYYHWGWLSFYDNIFSKNIDTSMHFFLKTGSPGMSINNNYPSREPVSFAGSGFLKQFNDQTAAKITSTSATFLQSQDKTPVNVKRNVLEIPRDADDKQVQQIINNAAKLKGTHVIIHFPAGKYKISKPVIIPAGTDMQLCGDGLLNASVIAAAPGFPVGNPMFKIMGPSSVTIRDLQMGDFASGKLNIDAVQFSNVDQPDSRAYVDQVYINANNAIRAEGLDYLYIEKDNSFFADNDFISGGPLVQKGKGTAGIFGYGGQFAGINLQDNAKAVYKDCWWEGNARVPLNLSGSGNLTIDGAMIAPVGADSNTTVSIKKFKGNISLLNMYLQGAVDVLPNNPDLKLLLMNIHFYFEMYPLKFLHKNASYKGLFSELSTQCFINGDLRCGQIVKLADGSNLASADGTFIPDMIADDRHTFPEKYEIKNTSASNILISRVSFGNVNNAIRFSR